MSFILDALKKSESERQRRAGPALFEVRVAPPRRRFPAWAVVLVALLAVNLGVVGWLVTRNAPSPAASTVRPDTAAAAPAPVAPTPLPSAALTPAPAAAAPAPPVRAPVRTEPESAPLDPELYDEPAFEPEELPVAQPPPTRVTRGTDLGVPTYDQLAGRPGANLPTLRLDLHAFSSEPAERFVFVNNTRLREGEALRDGTRVELITPEGAVLSVRGMRFLLQRQ